MSDFLETWTLVRGRFEQAIDGLNVTQLNWRLHPGTLTLGEMALHVAGVEVSFGTQLLAQQTEGLAERLRQAATDGSVNDNPFPFAPSEITPELVREGLDLARSIVEPILADPNPKVRETKIVSALGPVVDGTGAMARLAYHPGYHQGQAHIIRSAPGFPAG